MTKKELLNLRLQEVINKYEEEQRKLADKERTLFLEGFNYACLLLTRKTR
jgi:predicted metal-binding protein